ncbi:MAG: triose-phosphate isomerase [Oscillospiraceae bacterium]|nr:triose-phosphate isomerase [Oscillospiraceae bacterium]
MSRLDRLYIGTNTKMFKTASEAGEHIARLNELTRDIDDSRMTLFVIPSYTSLAQAVKVRGRVKIGAQNMGWEERGQFTGEISPLMLSELGVDMVMVGHSERRHVLHETDEEEQKKVACALGHGFTVLLCVGETLRQKEHNISDEVLAIQLKIGLELVRPEQLDRVMVAYEPVWAIGTAGIPADENYADARHAGIKDTLCGMFGEPGRDVPVLYGGSVNRGNCEPLIRKSNIDGLFIGRSAWDADNFSEIIHTVLPLFENRR